MRHFFKKIVAFTLATITILLMTSLSNAAYQVPDKIKVGLYFRDPSANINTAVPSFTVSASSGLQAGFLKDDNFTELYSEPASGLLTIMKDTYFSNANGSLKEYDPAGGSVPAGDKSGPFHIKIGGDYPDSATANTQVLAIRQKGLQAYPVFADTWQVWVGFYIDEASAQLDIANNVQTLLGEGAYSVISPIPNRIVVLNAASQAVAIFGSNSAYFQLRPAPENNPYIFSINSKQYRGILEVRRITGSDLTVINILPLKEYTYGTVNPEIGSDSRPEALKAQAVASKMYAIGTMGKHKKYGFDLCATTNCQVYKGYSSETPTTNKAVDDVDGMVLTYNGKLATQTFYFASSGGKTEDVQNVWGSPNPYLKSVEDKYEPIFKWTKTLRASDVKSRVSGVGNIMGMNVTKTSDAGRATELVVRGDGDRERIYTRDNIRVVFSLNSQLFIITTDADVSVASKDSSPVTTQLGNLKVITAAGVKSLTSADNKVTMLGANGQKKTAALVPETYTFSGKGWGHAVGMSQEGARSMAKAGIGFQEILSHYYQGTKVE